MPYSIETENKECNGFAVVKDSDKKIMGCHKTEKNAKDQITALNIAEAEEKADSLENIELREVDTKPPAFMQKWPLANRYQYQKL